MVITCDERNEPVELGNVNWLVVIVTRVSL
jgi:hypothetical protein